jgi:hypothetical protein
MFPATMCPSSGADDCVIFLPRVGIVSWLQEGCQVRLPGSASIDEFVAQLIYELIHGRTTCQLVLKTSLQPRHIPTQGYNITQSSAPDDEHMVARNMLSN